MNDYRPRLGNYLRMLSLYITRQTQRTRTRFSPWRYFNWPWSACLVYVATYQLCVNDHLYSCVFTVLLEDCNKNLSNVTQRFTWPPPEDMNTSLCRTVKMASFLDRLQQNELWRQKNVECKTKNNYSLSHPAWPWPGWLRILHVMYLLFV